MRKLFLLFIMIIFSTQLVFAKEIDVNIYAPKKITTSNANLKEGDSVSFLIAKDVFLKNELFLKKGEKITGVVTEMQENNFACEPAALLVENFKTTTASGNSIDLKGSSLYVKGRTHWMFTQFLILIPELIRGGEVQIKSNKTFTIYLDEKI